MKINIPFRPSWWLSPQTSDMADPGHVVHMTAPTCSIISLNASMYPHSPTMDIPPTGISYIWSLGLLDLFEKYKYVSKMLPVHDLWPQATLTLHRHSKNIYMCGNNFVAYLPRVLLLTFLGITKTKPASSKKIYCLLVHRPHIKIQLQKPTLLTRL